MQINIDTYIYILWLICGILLIWSIFYYKSKTLTYFASYTYYTSNNETKVGNCIVQVCKQSDSDTMLKFIEHGIFMELTANQIAVTGIVILSIKKISKGAL